MKIDDLEDRMRGFETALDPCVLPGVSMVARLDGRNFTRLTKEVHPFEAPFDRRFHLSLGRGQRHAKDHLAMFGHIGRLLGDYRAADDVVHLLPGEPGGGGRDYSKAAHLRRASRCCTASRVKTSVSRRRMS